MTTFQRQRVGRRGGLLALAVLAWSLYLLLMGAGCATTQKMVIHFAVADMDREPATVKFYRVTVTGKSTNLKSTVRTGFYDAKLLHDVFGEVRGSARPNDTLQSTGAVTFKFDPVTRSWEHLPPQELFTVIYGADAEALEKSITAYADSDEAGRTLGRLIAAAAGKKEMLDAEAAEQKQKKQAAAAKLVAAAFRDESAKITGWVTAAKKAAEEKIAAREKEKAAAEKKAADDKKAGETPAAEKTDTATAAKEETPPQKPADQSPKPPEVDAALLRLVKATVDQIGSSAPIGDQPDQGFKDARQLYDLLKQSGKN